MHTKEKKFLHTAERMVSEWRKQKEKLQISAKKKMFFCMHIAILLQLNEEEDEEEENGLQIIETVEVPHL
jgi:hypothetical protein